MSYEEYRTDVRDTGLWLVAWDSADIAAVLIDERRRDGSADTRWLAVLPRWRRRGVATVLLRRASAGRPVPVSGPRPSAR